MNTVKLRSETVFTGGIRGDFLSGFLNFQMGQFNGCIIKRIPDDTGQGILWVKAAVQTPKVLAVFSAYSINPHTALGFTGSEAIPR